MQQLNRVEQMQNESLREVRKKRYEKNGKQKHMFEQLQSIMNQIDFHDQQYDRIIIGGVPSKYRMYVWPQMLPNYHGITPNFYFLLNQKVEHYAGIHRKNKLVKARSNDFQQSQTFLQMPTLKETISFNPTSQPQNQKQDEKAINWMRLIQQDLPRTFAELKVFKKDTEQYKSLWNMLMCFAFFRQDVGYVQGMSQIASVLLLELNQQYIAFVAFCSLLTSDVIFSFFSFTTKDIKAFVQQVEHKVRKQDEQMFYFLQEREIQFSIFIIGWIMTLFSRCLEYDSLTQVYDMILMNEVSSTFLEELCLKLLLVLKKKIYACEDARQIIKVLKADKLSQLEEEELLKELRDSPQRKN